MKTTGRGYSRVNTLALDSNDGRCDPGSARRGVSGQAIGCWACVGRARLCPDPADLSYPCRCRARGSPLSATRRSPDDALATVTPEIGPIDKGDVVAGSTPEEVILGTACINDVVSRATNQTIAATPPTSRSSPGPPQRLSEPPPP